MQLSVPTLPFDLTAVLPAGATPTPGAVPPVPPPTAAAFSDLLNAEGAPTNRLVGDLAVPSDSPLAGQVVVTESATVAIPTPAMCFGSPRSLISPASERQQRAMPEWVVANGVSRAPADGKGPIETTGGPVSNDSTVIDSVESEDSTHFGATPQDSDRGDQSVPVVPTVVVAAVQATAPQQLEITTERAVTDVPAENSAVPNTAADGYTQSSGRTAILRANTPAASRPVRSRADSSEPRGRLISNVCVAGKGTTLASNVPPQSVTPASAPADPVAGASEPVIEKAPRAAKPATERMSGVVKSPVETKSAKALRIAPAGTPAASASTGSPVTELNHPVSVESVTSIIAHVAPESIAGKTSTAVPSDVQPVTARLRRDPQFSTGSMPEAAVAVANSAFVETGDFEAQPSAVISPRTGTSARESSKTGPTTVERTTSERMTSERTPSFVVALADGGDNEADVKINHVSVLPGLGNAVGDKLGLTAQPTGRLQMPGEFEKLQQGDATSSSEVSARIVRRASDAGLVRVANYGSPVTTAAGVAPNSFPGEILRTASPANLPDVPSSSEAIPVDIVMGSDVQRPSVDAVVETGRPVLSSNESDNSSRGVAELPADSRVPVVHSPSAGKAPEQFAAAALPAIPEMSISRTSTELAPNLQAGESVPVDVSVVTKAAAVVQQSTEASASEWMPQVDAKVSSTRRTDRSIQTLVGVPAATIGAATAALGRPTEKIAAVSPDSGDTRTSVQNAPLKKSLTSAEQTVVDSGTPLGINVAKLGSSMPALAHPLLPTPVIEAPSFSAVPLTFDALVQDGAQPPSELAQAARRAVESALAVVDHYATGEQKSVNLQFTVSGVDLAVRVELRGESVHTTFRTDSAELRHALATEWQAVSASQTGDRPQRLADPVFTSASTGSSASHDFGSATQNRDSGARQQPSLPPEFSGFRNAARTVSAQVSASTAPATPRATPASTSSRLNTFA